LKEEEAAMESDLKKLMEKQVANDVDEDDKMKARD